MDQEGCLKKKIPVGKKEALFLKINLKTVQRVQKDVVPALKSLAIASNVLKDMKGLVGSVSA